MMSIERIKCTLHQIHFESTKIGTHMMKKHDAKSQEMINESSAIIWSAYQSNKRCHLAIYFNNALMIANLITQIALNLLIMIYNQY